jgi:hypothetical protein
MMIPVEGPIEFGHIGRSLKTVTVDAIQHKTAKKPSEYNKMSTRFWACYIIGWQPQDGDFESFTC